MQILRKIWQRLGDPVFYRKKWRDLRRWTKSFRDAPEADSIEALGEVSSVLLIVAHPDDETFCSGLLCELVEQRSEVTVLCLTRGEGGPTGGATREELGRVREAEMRRSCETLGVKTLEFLDLVDPVAKGFRVYAPEIPVGELASRLLPFVEGADLVLSHGSSGEYWHPAHLLVHGATGQAVRHCPETRWMTFLARQPGHPIPRLVNLDDEAFLSLDVSARHGRRLEALKCHTSQLGLFSRFAGGGPEDFISQTARENYCLRQIPRDRGSD